jgi:hypothetical protein
VRAAPGNGGEVRRTWQESVWPKPIGPVDLRPHRPEREPPAGDGGVPQRGHYRAGRWAVLFCEIVFVRGGCVALSRTSGWGVRTSGWMCPRETTLPRDDTPGRGHARGPGRAGRCRQPCRGPAGAETHVNGVVLRPARVPGREPARGGGLRRMVLPPRRPCRGGGPARPSIAGREADLRLRKVIERGATRIFAGAGPLVAYQRIGFLGRRNSAPAGCSRWAQGPSEAFLAGRPVWLDGDRPAAQRAGLHQSTALPLQ